MKEAISILALCVLFMPGIHGQTLALSATPAQQDITTWSATNFTDYRSRPKPNASLIAGGIVTTCGLLFVSGGGILTLFSQGGGSDYDRGNTDMQNLGVGIMAVGGAMVIVGGIFTIKGAIQMHKENRWSIIAPKNNEIGLAYNF